MGRPPTCREFHFGARDRLLSLNVQGSPPAVEWIYDDAGFRIAETTPSDARRFRWDGETVAFETNVLGNLLMRYDHGPDRLLTVGVPDRRNVGCGIHDQGIPLSVKVLI